MTKEELSASDVIEITDALNRFAAGQDLAQPDVLESAFTEDAILDFTHPAGRLGVELQPFEGRRVIVETVVGATANLVTTHTVTNVRVVDGEGDVVVVTALIEAMHLPRNDPGRHLLLKNHLLVEMVRDGRQWLIQALRFRNAWHRGDREVLFPE